MKPKAFWMHGCMEDDELRQFDSGVLLPADWTGICRIYPATGKVADFETGIDNTTGQRYWNCIHVCGPADFAAGLR